MSRGLSRQEIVLLQAVMIRHFGGWSWLVIDHPAEFMHVSIYIYMCEHYLILWYITWTLIILYYSNTIILLYDLILCYIMVYHVRYSVMLYCIASFHTIYGIIININIHIHTDRYHITNKYFNIPQYDYYDLLQYIILLYICALAYMFMSTCAYPVNNAEYLSIASCWWRIINFIGMSLTK